MSSTVKLLQALELQVLTSFDLKTKFGKNKEPFESDKFVYTLIKDNASPSSSNTNICTECLVYLTVSVTLIKEEWEFVKLKLKKNHKSC